MQVYRNPPMLPNLSGLKLEYAIVQIYSKDAGQREVEIGFNVGQGTQDIGFRNTINILFDASPSVKVTLNVKDDDGSPTMASFLITDGIERILDDSVQTIGNADIRLGGAQRNLVSNFGGIKTSIRFLLHWWEFIHCLQEGLQLMMNTRIFSFNHRSIVQMENMCYCLPESTMLHLPGDRNTFPKK